MPVSTTPPLLKSQPDVAKLNTFTGWTVTVTKHLGPRGTVGQTVVSTQKMSLEQVLGLAMQLPLQHGPGFYMFTVVDTGGTGSDEWMTKLGQGDIPEVSQMSGMIQPPSTYTVPPGVVDLGHGFLYNETVGTLTTPWRKVYNWAPNQPLPEAPAAMAAPQTFSLPNASPWPPAGWGSFPVNADSDARTRQVEAQLAEERNARQEERRERQMDEMRVEMRRQADEQARRFEALVERITARPAGPSESELALRRELDEQKREAVEQRRRNEDREREDRLRTEMRAQQERSDAVLRELQSNKQDPMMPMLLQLLNGSQASAQRAVEAIQAATTTAASASERSTQQMVERLAQTIISPATLIQMMQSATDRGSEGVKLVVESLKDSLGMQREVFTQLLDVAGSNNQSPWVTIAQEALQRVGAVGQALANRQPQQPQPQRVAVQPPAPQPITAAPMAGAPAKLPQQQPAPQAPQTPQAPRNGTTTHTGAPTQAAQAPAQPKKRGRKKKQPPAAMETPPEGGYTIEQIAKMEPKDVWEGVKQFDDATFFGPIMPYVAQIREQAATSMKPEGVAEMLLRNRTYLQHLGEMPPAAEMLFAKQIEVLVAKLLPAPVTEDYREAVVEAIEAQLAEEEEREGGGEDDEAEGDEEGDEETETQ